MISRPPRLTPDALQILRARRDRLTPARRWALRAASVAIPLVAWEVGGRLVNPILLSHPTAVFAAGLGMLADGSLLRALGSSLVVLVLGLFAGTVIGVALGLLAGRRADAAALLELPVNALYATPTVALIPLIVIWFGFDVLAKTAIVFLFVVFPVLINTRRGVREVDPELVEVATTFCSSERRMWLDLFLPSALPYIVTGIRLAIGRALIGVIVAEYYTALSGLGNQIATSANSFQTARMFVPITLITLLGVGLTAFLEWIEHRLARWRKAAS
jgi:ABC-type nitrate/sulfonate/bicarbonate transport system permease component